MIFLRVRGRFVTTDLWKFPKILQPLPHTPTEPTRPRRLAARETKNSPFDPEQILVNIFETNHWKRLLLGVRSPHAVPEA